MSQIRVDLVLNANVFCDHLVFIYVFEVIFELILFSFFCITLNPIILRIISILLDNYLIKEYLVDQTSEDANLQKIKVFW